MQTPTASTTSFPPHTLEVVLALALVVLVAGAGAMLVSGLTRRLLLKIEGDRFHTQPFAATTVRLVRRLFFGLLVLILVFPALDFAGLDMSVGLRDEEVARWAARTGIRVVLLLLLTFAVNRFAAAVVRRAEHEIGEGDGLGSYERRKRANTLGATFRRFISALTWTTALLVILRELDVDITPVLTGAGILGLAVGFGAQTLVKDIISGIFLIAEDQVRVGDVAVVNNISGAVEEINLRTIVLRDEEGVVYTIPNGEIRTLANRSKDFAYYVINLSIAFEDDTDAVTDAIRAAATDLMQDPAFAPSILAPVEILGVDDFKASQVTLKFRIKTLPLKQWEVGRELRRRVKRVFDARGIKLPTPKMDVNVTNVKSL
ncbi:MAG: mechanosensitive ion channel family protein [Vicinamibacterales bacterium]